jgi:hypothetical protein
METAKRSLFSHCPAPPRPRLQSFISRCGRRSMCAIGVVASGFFAFSSLSLAKGGGHMSGQSNQGPSSQNRGRYWDPFWGSGWHPGYAGDYDSNYSYPPTPSQVSTAQQKVKDYLTAVSKGRRRPATHRYLAVETLKPTKKQLDDYARKQDNAKSAAAAGGGQMSNRWVSPNQLRCLMVFDTQSKKFVGSGCYVVGNLPPVGTIAKFDTYSAEFVGGPTL